MFNASLVSEVDIGCRDDWWDRVHLLHADGGQGSARGGALQHTDLAQIIWVEYTTYVLYS